LRILNIVENLDKGAVENWLVNVFLTSRQMRPDWDWTFYCILGRPGRLDEKVKAAGGKIIYAPFAISEKRKFLEHLRKELKAGRYDIIHSHHDYLSGFYLLSSRGIQFRKRILHVHNTDKALPVGSRFMEKLLLKPFRWLGYRFSDVIVGISEDTLIEFTHRHRTRKPRTAILYYGINLDAYGQKSAARDFLLANNLPEDANVLLFVGRMNEWKNPLFVVEILRELAKKGKDVYGVFVGQGDLQKEILTRAKAENISHLIRVVGWSDNIPLIMKSATVFVFPRLEYPREGLGLVVVEAQAAGLPLVISNAIVKDAIVIPELAHYVKLDDNPAEWAEVIQKILNSPAALSRDEALQRMKNSHFELSQATQNLLSLYESHD